MPKPLTIKQLLIASLLPGLLYVALFLMRPIWFQAICGSHPESCALASVNEFDQLAFKFGSVFADFCSNIVQNSVGTLAFLLPWILRVPSGLSIRLNLTLLSITAWNGVTVEIVRALVQRPRPLVYASPLTDGANIHQYTSFYSGHTSFVTLATLFSLLWVSALLPGKKKTRLTLAILFPVLSLLTGILRVAGGRHYPTDVLGGMVFGSIVCLGVMRWLWPTNAIPKSADS
jgi:membrane-associated phospholipid phosphatase